MGLGPVRQEKKFLQELFSGTFFQELLYELLSLLRFVIIKPKSSYRNFPLGSSWRNFFRNFWLASGLGLAADFNQDFS